MSTPSLSTLLVQWAEAYEQGHDLAAEQLCPDRHDLLAELTRRIDELRRLRTSPVPPPADWETRDRIRAEILDATNKSEKGRVLHFKRDD
jgi:hypothetical protein